MFYKNYRRVIYFIELLCWPVFYFLMFGLSSKSELRVAVGLFEGEALSNGSIPILAKPQSVPVNDASLIKTGSVPTLTEDGQGKKCLLKWKGPKKINRIYADWLDDLPLVQNLPSKVES